MKLLLDPRFGAGFLFGVAFSLACMRSFWGMVICYGIATLILVVPVLVKEENTNP